MFLQFYFKNILKQLSILIQQADGKPVDNNNHGGMITGGLIRKRVLSMTSSRSTVHKKLK